jgi:dolichyl-phosphate-mannose-protein mannosyltransferase
MLQTSIIVELLRSQPRLTFWFMALTQTVLWWVFPSLFFSSPPGELPVVLAVGHEYQLGSYFGPPLAFWLADIAFVAGGTTAVYLLAQVCVLVMLWAVFTLGRAVVGIHHAAFAVLLMVGIAAFSAPTPNFGPSVLAMPLVALSLLSLWRAVGEQRRVSWFVLGLELGLLILTTYAGLILLGLIMVFLAATRRGRSAMRSVEPWLASVLIAVVLFPHLMWLDRSNGLAALGLRPLQGENAPVAVLKDWLSLFEAILIAHIGLAILVALGSKWHLRTDEKVPVFVRSFTDPFARLFVYYFAIAPGLVAVTVAAILGERSPVGGIAPHLVLSGLAIIMLAGNAIPWHRPRMVGAAWVLLLFAPPLVAAAGILLLPWTGWSSTDVSRPAKAMGEYFSDSFQRRTGAPLRIVSGETRIAALVAMGSPQRPSLYFYENPEWSPWVTTADLRSKGLVLVWPGAENEISVPVSIVQRFPDLVAEVPHGFARPVQGRLPLIRIGWAMRRPGSELPTVPPPESEAKPEAAAPSEPAPAAEAKPEATPEAKQ